jgi:hypothetical protein
MPTYISKGSNKTNRQLQSDCSARLVSAGPVELGIAFDSSESMAPLRQVALNGFNTLLREQQKLQGAARFSLSFFNNEIRKIHDGISIAAVPTMEEADYAPAGGTALYDAIGSLITQIGDRVDPSPHLSRVLVAILTDGQENSSKRFSKTDIFEQISFRRNACNWQFLFLGVGGDTTQTGLSLGIQRSNILRFDADPATLEKIMSSLSNTFRAYQLGDKNFALLLKG